MKRLLSYVCTTIILIQPLFADAKGDLEFTEGQIEQLKEGIRAKKATLRELQDDATAAQRKLTSLRVSAIGASPQRRKDIDQDIKEQESRARAAQQQIDETNENIASNEKAIEKYNAEIPSLRQKMAEEVAVGKKGEPARTKKIVQKRFLKSIQGHDIYKVIYDDGTSDEVGYPKQGFK